MQVVINTNEHLQSFARLVLERHTRGTLVLVTVQQVLRASVTPLFFVLRMVKCVFLAALRYTDTHNTALSLGVRFGCDATRLVHSEKRSQKCSWEIYY